MAAGSGFSVKARAAMSTIDARRMRRVLLVAMLLVPLWGATAPLEPGAVLPRLSLSDQHDKPWTTAPGTRQVLFAADKAASDLANPLLAAQGPGFLSRGGIVYLADISAMPAMVTRVFALPKLRELPFEIGLVRETAVAADLPRQPGKVTVLDLDQGVITQIRYVADAKALRLALGIAAE